MGKRQAIAIASVSGFFGSAGRDPAQPASSELLFFSFCAFRSAEILEREEDLVGEKTGQIGQDRQNRGRELIWDPINDTKGN